MSLHLPSSVRSIVPPHRAHGGRSAFRIATLAMALVFGAAACGDDDNGPVAVAEPADIALSETSVTLVRGRTNTVQIAATVTGTSNSALTWTVGNPSVATVSQTGLVTAVADGSTFITATSTANPLLNRSVVINVVSTVVTVSPSGGTFSYVGGPARTLSVTIQNNDNTAVTWRSSNTAVATVSATGVVTPVAAGTTNIIAQSVADPVKESAVLFTVDAAPFAGFTELTSGASVAIAGTTGDKKRYFISVPPGATNLTVAVAGPGGDADLYLYAGNATLANMTALSSVGRVCAPFLAGSNETCTVANPQPRLYYVVVDAYETYAGGTISVTITP